MKVIYFSKNYTPHDYRFLSSLAQTEHEIFFLQLEATTRQTEDRPVPANVEQILWAGGRSEFRWRDVPRLTFDLRRVIKEIQPDLIHAGPIQNSAFLAARELAPVLGLMVAGRVGGSIAAEIGTMRVTEQINALTTLSVSPMKYLVVPRVIAGTLMLPVLVLIGDIIGVYGRYIVSTHVLGFSAGSYLHQTWDVLERMDVISGLVKASAFGFIVTVMGCYHGYHSVRGAQGVGTATTNAVVTASILILIFNFILTQIFFS